MSISPPRVFISYSHDSATHKQWVLEFATTLRNRGVDAILDQWDLRPGDDILQFMGKNLANADYAVMVCTRRYVEKANKGEGGVGYEYEKMIMTSSSLSNISGNKIIPIVREKGEPSTPTFLKTKLSIDFSDDEEVEFALDELLRVLLGAPLYEKPEIGNNPFRPLEKSRPNKTSDGIRNVMTSIAETFDATSRDTIFFADLVQKTKLRRLTLDKYLGEAIKAGLLQQNSIRQISVTEKGIEYLMEKQIIDT